MTRTFTHALAVTLATVLAIATFSLYAFQAAAYERGGSDGDRTEIETENSARITNSLSVEAKTGHNDANGGDGGDGDDGGDASMGTGGRGGNGGPGGAGGTVTTGEAIAYGDIINDINRTDVTVEGCGCDDDEMMPFFGRFSFFGMDRDGMRLEIETENSVDLANSLDVEAKTGGNDVNGGDGGDGDDGGDAGSRHSRSWNNWFMWWNTNTAGDGGAGGRGGDAGTVRSGDAYADGVITNLVNRTVVRSGNGDDEDDEE